MWGIVFDIVSTKRRKKRKMAKKLTKKEIEKIKDKLAKDNRSVKRRNEQFAKLSPSEKRVQIARDVIAQLASKKLIATAGVWLTGTDGDNLFDEKDVERNPELQEILSKQESCEGCALGGMFMCAVERHDKLKLTDLEVVKDYKQAVKDIGDDANLDSGEASEDDATHYLKKFFSEAQLNDIEAAFERGGGAKSGSNSAQNFADEVDDDGERMRLIMENIIVNKGKFVPSKPPVQTWTTPGFLG